MVPREMRKWGEGERGEYSVPGRGGGGGAKHSGIEMFDTVIEHM